MPIAFDSVFAAPPAMSGGLCTCLDANASTTVHRAFCSCPFCASKHDQLTIAAGVRCFFRLLHPSIPRT